LFPALLPSERGQIEIVVRSVEQIDSAVGCRVGVKNVLALAQEDAHSPTLAAVRRGMEVVVEIAAIRGEPRDSPIHPGLEWLNLRQCRTGDEDQRGIARMEMGQMADIVDQERAERTALFPARIKHKMVDNQLAAPIEEVKQTRLAVRPLEEIQLVDLDHGQPATFGTEPVSRARGCLFLDEQGRSRGKPLVS